MIKKVWSRLDRISMDKEFLKVSQGISECSFERLRGVPGRINGSFRSIFFLFYSEFLQRKFSWEHRRCQLYFNDVSQVIQAFKPVYREPSGSPSSQFQGSPTGFSRKFQGSSKCPLWIQSYCEVVSRSLCLRKFLCLWLITATRVEGGLVNTMSKRYIGDHSIQFYLFVVLLFLFHSFTFYVWSIPTHVFIKDRSSHPFV